VKAVAFVDEWDFLICEAALYPVRFNNAPVESVILTPVEKSVP